MNTAENFGKTITDVVEDFDYSTQNESYNKSFRTWRKNKNNPFAFNFSENTKESIFIDGKGFVNTSRTESEHLTISRIFFIIGSAMLIWVTTENIISKIIICILDLVKIDIHTIIFSTAYYGGSIEMVSTLIIITLIKMILPILYIQRKLKMPLKVGFMNTMNDSAELLHAIGLALIVCTVASIPDAYSSSAKEIYDYFKSINADISVWGQAEYVIYTIFDVIIVSVVSEILFRGAVFSALRQFGDIFAIMTTSVMAALLTQDLCEMPVAFLISFIASVGMLKSGSVFTAFAVNIIYKMYQLSIVIIETSTSESMVFVRNITMTAIFIMGSFMVIVIHFTKKDKKHLAVYNSETSFKDLLTYGLKTYPFWAVAVICLVSGIIKIVY